MHIYPVTGMMVNSARLGARALFGWHRARAMAAAALPFTPMVGRRTPTEYATAGFSAALPVGVQEVNVVPAGARPTFDIGVRWRGPRRVWNRYYARWHPHYETLRIVFLQR